MTPVVACCRPGPAPGTLLPTFSYTTSLDANADRITRASRAANLREKADTCFYIGEDVDYLRELKRVDPTRYRSMMIRVWPARVLRPVLRLLPSKGKAG